MARTSVTKTTKVKTATPKNRIETPLKETSNENGDLNQKVAQKAYELFVARGCAHGYHVEDWLAAERIVKGA